MAENEENNILEGLFLHEKPARLLISAKTPKYATQLAKEVDCTFSHTVKLLEQFRKMGLVVFKKTGRIKMVSLTDDGQEIANYLEGLVTKITNLEKAQKNKENPQ
ncbi:MAG: helix-turn-helix transcriptional regulator [Candidatus Aenigmarchaeota archaeon]|nr:helix-turn-helix transcriptional regulator [Candidatus Aenigmarchaeota archaeon]